MDVSFSPHNVFRSFIVSILLHYPLFNTQTHTLFFLNVFFQGDLKPTDGLQ